MSIADGKRVLTIEASAIMALINRLDDRFERAVDILHQCGGKVVVIGMGKSGLIAAKLASTFASTGTPSFFLHAAEGVHGDIGMITRNDVALIVSNSGETLEVIQLLSPVLRLGVPVVALVGNVHSTLAKHSRVVLDVSVAEEACPLGLAPTASTTAALAMGDALAVSLLKRRGFNEEDFAVYHPGGILGRRLLLRVADLMHTGDAVPKVSEHTPMKGAILEMTIKKLGMTTVEDRYGRLAGIITDGDLRRGMEQHQNFMLLEAREVMTREPKLIDGNALGAEALHMMEQFAITSLVIVDQDARTVGIVHLHDCLKAGIA